MADNELFGNSEQLESSLCGHGKDHVADPGKMVGDLISRAAAINAICEDGTRLERQGQYTMTMVERKQRDADILEALPSAQQNCDGCKWSDAIGYGECHHCKRAFEDMYEKGEQP